MAELLDPIAGKGGPVTFSDVIETNRRIEAGRFEKTFQFPCQQ